MATAPAAFFLLLVLAVVAADSSCPKDCYCTFFKYPIVINCSYLGLLDFPTNISTQTEALDLSYNVIRTLPVTFNELVELRYLSLAHNHIAELRPWSFQALHRLQTLDLSSNHISDLAAINANTFVLDATALEFLNLSNNPITMVEDIDALGVIHSKSLRVLDLSSCNIKYIDGGKVLNELSHLERLNLSRNLILWISELKSATLRHLDLSRCKLYDMKPIALRGLQALETLDVSHNKKFFFSINTTILSSSVRQLDASFCDILTTNLDGFPNLTHANLRGNAISLSSHIFSNAELVDLDLTENNIVEINDKAFVNLKKLERLKLRGNHMSRLNPNLFSINQNLIALDISNNYFTKLDFLRIRRLEFLDVSECRIKEMDPLSLIGCPYLLTLNLSYNGLEYLPENIESSSLTHLNLSFCKLRTLGNSSFRKLPLLNYLSLAGNQFTDPLSAQIISRNNYLEEISIRDNPWKCDCNTNLFTYLYHYLAQIKSDIGEIICLIPRGKYLIDLCSTAYSGVAVQEDLRSTQQNYNASTEVIATTQEVIATTQKNIDGTTINSDFIQRSIIEGEGVLLQYTVPNKVKEEKIIEEGIGNDAVDEKFSTKEQANTVSIIREPSINHYSNDTKDNHSSTHLVEGDLESRIKGTSRISKDVKLTSLTVVEIVFICVFLAIVVTGLIAWCLWMFLGKWSKGGPREMFATCCTFSDYDTGSDESSPSGERKPRPAPLVEQSQSAPGFSTHRSRKTYGGRRRRRSSDNDLEEAESPRDSLSTLDSADDREQRSDNMLQIYHNAESSVSMDDEEPGLHPSCRGIDRHGKMDFSYSANNVSKKKKSGRHSKKRASKR